VPALPLDGSASRAETPSPSTRPTSRKTSVATLSRRATTATPAVRRKSLALPKERRIPSAPDSSPSPVTRHRLSQARRTSLASNALSPLRTSHRASVAHEPQRRLSVIHHNDDERPKDNFNEFRPRADSLAPLPDHLEMSSTSDSIPVPLQGDDEITPPSAVVSRVQISPSQPVPNRSAFQRIGDRRLSNAVEDLEDMVHEAVEIADRTEDRGQVEEIYDIIDEARTAVQEASGEPARQLMATVPPLKVSESSDDVDETSSQTSPGDHSASNQHTQQPARTPPPAPIGIQRNILNDHMPEVPTGLQRGSASFDWAYPNRDRKQTNSPSTSDSQEESRSRFSTRSDLLLPPQPVQAGPRDHVDFVLRPMARNESPHRHVRHRHRRSHEDPSRSRSRHIRHGQSGSSQLETSFDDEDLPARAYGNELNVREQAHHHTFSLRRHYRRQPIARNWSTGKKRLTATIACINTALLGIIIGVYAGEVPRIQYFLADEHHIVILGNVVLYSGLAISTFFAWTLPLLHGRKPYVLAALAIALPLQFPQAIVVTSTRSPTNAKFRTGLLCARALSGLVLGFANVNYITVLLDLFGASLQSKNPHQEFVVANDVRRHGGGMGMWLGIWSWCWIGSLAVGFQVGAAIIEDLTPDWGFYIVVIILVSALVLNIFTPETRRAQYRRSVTEVYDRDENYITRRVSRGEVKLHISTEGPKYWFEEVWAGMKLMIMMLCQPGLLVLALYLGWIYTQIVLVIVLLGALLSRDYRWRPRYVGAGVMSIAIGAFLAIPLTKAGIFSRERKRAFRTDSMTFQKQVTWSSHLVRRAIFTLTLPLMGLAYTVSSAGRPKPYMVPIVFAGAVGFLSILAIAECHGLMMETFDTCDLQPGVNTRHRLESMAVQDRRRRTNYTSFPRVTAGIFASQTFAFIGAAVATEVGGSMTRHLGAQASTGVTAGILLGLTILLTVVLWRYKEVQVIPNHTFGTRRDTAAWQEFKDLEKIGRGSDWKAVVIGNPSGKMRRMSVLELGSLSRWTEIRKLNSLLKGPRLGEEKEKKKRSFRESR
jgi:MFS family permease